MINFVKGDIFTADVEALVNPVNCVGVMGAGLAKQFKCRYPYNYILYREACKQKVLKLGTVHYVFVSTNKPQYVINFPTKHHWRENSTLKNIESGLEALVLTIKSREIRSIAIPRLGCGLGGLNWEEVKPLIVKYLGPLERCDTLIYE